MLIYILEAVCNLNLRYQLNVCIFLIVAYFIWPWIEALGTVAIDLLQLPSPLLF